MRLVYLLLTAILASSQLSAQEVEATCLSSIAATAPSEDFVLRDNGETWQISTNLIWMRCAYGQTWDGDSCSGEAEPLTWLQALELSRAFSSNGSNAWRLPNVKELSSIVERACLRPAINAEVFPNTPSDNFWSSTPSLMEQTQTWVVAFFNGNNALKEKERTHFVRMVRTSLPQERVVE